MSILPELAWAPHPSRSPLGPPLGSRCGSAGSATSGEPVYLSFLPGSLVGAWAKDRGAGFGARSGRRPLCRRHREVRRPPAQRQGGRRRRSGREQRGPGEHLGPAAGRSRPRRIEPPRRRGEHRRDPGSDGFLHRDAAARGADGQPRANPAYPWPGPACRAAGAISGGQRGPSRHRSGLVRQLRCLHGDFPRPPLHVSSWQRGLLPSGYSH